MSSQEEELRSLSLSQLFARALTAASDASELNTNEEPTQALLRSAYSALSLAQSLLRARGVFSPNEQLEDVSTQGLVFMLVDVVAGEIVGRLTTKGRSDRLQRLAQCKANFESYIRMLDSYGVVEGEDREKLARTGARDPAKRREEKIRHYRWEKEVREKLELLALNRNPPMLEPPSNDYLLILSLLPSSSQTQPTSSSNSTRLSTANSVPSDSLLTGSSSSDDLRIYTISLLSLLYAQSLAQLESIKSETELLESMPADLELLDQGADDTRQRERENEGAAGTQASWRLDSVNRGGPDGKGELMDAKGKPLRPFTILPSGGAMDDRARLAAEVFRSGHRLPTMSIDEYLKNEFDSGNVITGGGQASEDAPTSSEILQIASENDGTRSGREADDQKRDKEEKWARYTDDNPKGAGNTMNRG
ncbi:TAP42-like protein [Mrakia frigida]|uniref:Tap42p n=1 Tax=Mrakia frigida TaxID=29902 RepID=UPI003FCC0311